MKANTNQATPKRHGNTGKRNAAKDDRKEAVITFRLSKEQKSAYINAAGGVKLADWIKAVLDKEAGL